MMTEQQIELLADIQRLVFSGPGQTGCAMNHSYTIHPNGMVTSSVQVMSTDFKSSEYISKAVANQVAVEDAVSLTEQRDALADWIAENRKEEAS